MSTTQSYSQPGNHTQSLARGSSDEDYLGNKVCPVCKGSTWELYWDGQYEIARKCHLCKGVNDITIQKRREGAGLPSRYSANVTLDDFDISIYSKVEGGDAEMVKQMQKVMHYVDNFVSNFYEWEQRGMGLYLYSSTKGSGKSYLASCLTNSLISKYAIPMKYISASELLERSKIEDGIKDLQDIKLLVLDDLGQKNGGQSWMDDVMFRLVDYRNSNGKITIYTSNLKPTQLPMDERVVDRICEKALQLNLPEVSVRASLGKSDKMDFIKSLKIGG